MRGEMRRKEEASKAEQTTRQSNTAHPRQSLFIRKMSSLGWDSEPSTMYTLYPYIQYMLYSTCYTVPCSCIQLIHVYGYTCIHVLYMYTWTCYCFSICCHKLVCNFLPISLVTFTISLCACTKFCRSKTLLDVCKSADYFI